MDVWKVIAPLNEADQVWHGSEDEEESEEDEDEEEDFEGLIAHIHTLTHSRTDKRALVEGDEGDFSDEGDGENEEAKEEDEEGDQQASKDSSAVGKGETLREYFDRTQSIWLAKASADIGGSEAGGVDGDADDGEIAPELVHEAASEQAQLDLAKKKEKKIRSRAFTFAQQAYFKSTSTS